MLRFAFFSIAHISNYTVTSSEVRSKDIKFIQGNCVIDLWWSKILQRKAQGTKLKLAPTGDTTCLVKAMKLYLCKDKGPGSTPLITFKDRTPLSAYSWRQKLKSLQTEVGVSLPKTFRRGSTVLYYRLFDIKRLGTW